MLTSMLMFLLFAVLACAAVALYFLPSIIANNRCKKNAISIFVINLFFGWTFVGWVVSLAWAFAKD
jgi:hypothetical protein